jgi:hypothetical protein
MSFLKKLGQVAAQVGALALGIGPLVSPLFGSKGDQVGGHINTLSNDLTLIGQVIVQIETALQGQTGADKRKAAIALIGPIIKTSQIVSGKKIADAALLDTGIGQITDGMVAILNAIHEDSVKTEIKPQGN